MNCLVSHKFSQDIVVVCTFALRMLPDMLRNFYCKIRPAHLNSRRQFCPQNILLPFGYGDLDCSCFPGSKNRIFSKEAGPKSDTCTCSRHKTAIQRHLGTSIASTAALCSPQAVHTNTISMLRDHGTWLRKQSGQRRRYANIYPPIREMHRNKRYHEDRIHERKKQEPQAKIP